MFYMLLILNGFINKKCMRSRLVWLLVGKVDQSLSGVVIFSGSTKSSLSFSCEYWQDVRLSIFVFVCKGGSKPVCSFIALS